MDSQILIEMLQLHTWNQTSSSAGILTASPHAHQNVKSIAIPRWRKALILKTMNADQLKTMVKKKQPSMTKEQQRRLSRPSIQKHVPETWHYKNYQKRTFRWLVCTPQRKNDSWPIGADRSVWCAACKFYSMTKILFLCRLYLTGDGEVKRSLHKMAALALPFKKMTAFIKKKQTRSYCNRSTSKVGSLKELIVEWWL